MNDYFDNPRNKTVRKSNELIQKSRFDLSLQQQKIVLFLISQISPYDEAFKTYEFNINEFCKICGIDLKGGKSYVELKEHIQTIASKNIWIKTDEETESLVRWIEKPRIKTKSGIIEIKLDEDLKPYLLQLRENFTQYDLIFTLSFKSKYTIRLYELIKSIHYNELNDFTKDYPIEELKKLLNAETYTKYQHFKERVLMPSVEEINKMSDKKISFTPIKSGRKITHIRLTVGTKDIVERIEIRALVENTLDKQITFSDEGIINE